MAAAFNGEPNQLDSFTALERARCATNVEGAFDPVSGKPGHDSDFWVDKADFWKLRQVSLSYELPASLVGRYADRATFTLSGRNLFTWTDFQGTDPEIEDFTDRVGQVSEGSGEYGRREYYNLPATRTFLFSLHVTF
jgi:hypothetical protein